MIKSELIESLASAMTHLPEKQVTQGVNLILEHMSHALATGDRIEIRGFGSFTPRFRKPRRARNPKTTQQLMTRAKYTPHFKPGKALRDRVNTSRHSKPLVNEADES